MQDLLKAYWRLGKGILEGIEPDEAMDPELPIFIRLLSYVGSHSEEATVLQPELPDAYLHLLGSEWRAG